MKKSSKTFKITTEKTWYW